MIVDERTYSLQPGLVGAYLENHFKNALPIMRQYLGEPYGYFVSETGELNQFVHLWHYEDMADRERRRKAMYDDPRWVAYRASTGERGLVTRQHNRILRAIEIPVK
jgi:NIPSNAP